MSKENPVHAIIILQRMRVLQWHNVTDWRTQRSYGNDSRILCFGRGGVIMYLISEVDFDCFAHQMAVTFPFMPKIVRDEWIERIDRVRASSLTREKQLEKERILVELNRLYDTCDKYDSHGRGKQDAYDMAIQVVENGGERCEP
jgi:hypothetical protein